MSRDSIVLNFEKCTKIKEVVNELNRLEKELKPLATNQIKIRFGTFVLPELLVVIASYIRYYRGLKYDIVVNEITPDNNYLERCDFYKSINYAHATKRFRFKNKNLKELTSVDVNLGIQYAMGVCDSIVEIIKSNYNVEDNTYRTISFLLWELIDNILIHAKVKDEFNIIVQNHPTKKELTVCIVDKGIGIHSALANTKGSKFSHFTPKTALFNCINKSITNGKGMGNGLYITRKFIEENKGELLLYSGPYCLWLDEKNPLDIHRVPSWKGTIVCLKIKTENAVDLVSIFDGDIPTSITEHEEMIGGLW